RRSRQGENQQERDAPRQRLRNPVHLPRPLIRGILDWGVRAGKVRTLPVYTEVGAHMGRGIKTFGTTLVAGIVAVAACAPVAGADTTAPTWNCRASTAYLINQLIPIPSLGLVLPDPIVANGNPDPDN